MGNKVKKLILILLFLIPTFGQADTLNTRLTAKQLGDIFMWARVYSARQTYVGSQYATNDSTKDGKTWASAVASLTEAIAKANLNLPRNSTNPVAIKVSDYFISDSIYTLPAYTAVYAPLGEYTNKTSWTFGTGSFVIDVTNLGGVSAINNITGLQDSLNNRPRTYRYATTGKTSNTTLTNVVPAGCRVKDVVITNTTANAVYVNIGSGAGLTDVANNIEVPASDFVVFQPNNIFSASATQTLYLHSANWNSASLNIIMIFEKLF